VEYKILLISGWIITIALLIVGGVFLFVAEYVSAGLLFVLGLQMLVSVLMLER
jgi:hypothetical protein